MDGFIIKLGNALTTALGISIEATSTLLLLGLIWFYVFKWRPYAKSIDNHMKEEVDANDNYIVKSSERDRLSEDMRKSIVELNDVISELVESLDKAKLDRDSIMRDSQETRRIVIRMKEEIIRINIRLEMSPNARSLS